MSLPRNFTRLRDLHLGAPSQPGRMPHISAASGLVCLGASFYVIADDELQLAHFPLNSGEPGALRPLLPGVLPLDPVERKRTKPDFEALALIGDGLLALPSGSKRNRVRGAWISVESQESRIIDFSALYEHLERRVPELNVEGAVAVGDRLKLFQRGNGKSGFNAVIDLDLEDTLRLLKSGRFAPGVLRSITEYDLGALDGVKLGFTDAAPLGDGRILYVAAAEAGESTYEDGVCGGSVMGIIDQNGQAVWQHALAPNLKAEGVWVHVRDGKLEALFVTDGDDATKPAGLYASSPLSIPSPFI